MRIYTAQFDNIAVSAAQDLFAIIATTTTKMVQLLRVVLSDNDATIPASQTIGIQVVNFIGITITAGTGGASATIQKTDNGDAAQTGFTVSRNNTTQATSTGTVQIVYDGGFHLYNGLDESFQVDPANPRGAIPLLNPGAVNAGTILVRMQGAPTGTIHLNGTVWIGESG